MAQTQEAKSRIYQAVLKDILEALESGVAPWNIVFNRHTSAYGNKYRGVNRLICNMSANIHGFGSLFWGTKKAILKEGGRIKREEFKNSTNILFMKPYFYIKDSGAKIKEKDLESKNMEDVVKSWMLKYYSVWNFDQTTLDDPEVFSDNDKLTTEEKGERLIESYTEMPKLKLNATPPPCYITMKDEIRMPKKSYTRIRNWYPILWHELVHSTGHPSRCSRFTDDKTGHEDYAMEELVAELGSAFLSADLNMLPENNIDTVAGYLDGWRKVISDDPSLIIRASADAETAVDFIRDHCDPEVF